MEARDAEIWFSLVLNSSNFWVNTYNNISLFLEWHSMRLPVEDNIIVKSKKMQQAHIDTTIQIRTL